MVAWFIGEESGEVLRVRDGQSEVKMILVLRWGQNNKLVDALSVVGVFRFVSVGLVVAKEGTLDEHLDLVRIRKVPGGSHRQPAYAFRLEESQRGSGSLAQFRWCELGRLAASDQ